MGKCNMDCFNCTRPVEKCHGGDFRKSAVPYRLDTKTTVGHGDPRLSCPGRQGVKPHRMQWNEDEAIHATKIPD